ncbi:glycosyltransferase [Paracoccus sp. TK19116]|uniref:Glycosyltransferase n=1 Tax=Paracoccus albicereus TaxID=2922394 RepID=A0ABT1MS80_9RHOB|nr:glycosyltransferase [Paracoccus albicereus]MCQ0971167.1 glycosyltransferase [Paracoccus albicereus]
MMNVFARNGRRQNVVPLQPNLTPRNLTAPDGDAPPPIDQNGATLAPRNLRPLGQILLEEGAVREGDLLKATVLRRRQDARLGEILLAHGWVTEAALGKALSRQWRTSVIDLLATPPDPRLIDAAGAQFCLNRGIVPWRRLGGVTWVATSRPDEFDALIPSLPRAFGTVRMLICEAVQGQEAILATRRGQLIRQAEMRVPADQSCRSQDSKRTTRIAIAAIATAALAFTLMPIVTVALLTIWAIAAMLASTMVKISTLVAAVRGAHAQELEESRYGKARTAVPEFTGPLPVISVMVPLFRESDIAGRLVERLSRLDYPRELTDILLVVEERDDTTRDALRGAALPRWMRVVVVPEGPIQTKPRAMNFALNFCRGSIIGVWDAEDRPERDQLHRVARGFHAADPDVACLQGALDFYNPRTNLMARCFTIEYATWFRAYLPGLARMRLIVPLGGTTLFFRRDALDQVGGWDAWNVTEDADLGVRLVRHGWRTEIIPTTTDEEANCRPLPWIKQRSRWIKGFALTWAVHMRDPRRLWRELGPARFIGMQVQLFGSVSQQLLAPLLWSFWLLAFGLPHPLATSLSTMLGGYGVMTLVGIFIAAEAISIVASLWAVRGAKHRHLRLFVPLMHFYNVLACFAAWKAIYEVVTRPFYWDKTTHGVFEASLKDATADAAQAEAGTVQIPMLGPIGGRSLDDVAADRGEPQRPAANAAIEDASLPIATAV